jgi:hypothetical protein
MQSKFCVCLLVGMFLAPFVLAASDSTCPASQDYRAPHRFDRYVVRIIPGVPPHGKDRFEFRCLGTIMPPQGVRKTIAKDWTMAVDPISGSDVSGGGKPDVVFEGHTSGARCCYEYWVASLTRAPRLIKKRRSPLQAKFETTADGTVEIRIPDAAFQFFMLPFEDAVTPMVIFRLEGDKIVDVGSQHQQEYDEQISKARGEIKPGELENFRQSRYNDKLFTDQMPAVKAVLSIVLDYLYSGREQQAWQTLQEMWPASDQARVKATILERRERGIVNQLLATQKKPGA